MIPLRLDVTNFLSYQETTGVDLNDVRLACITGQNGAGKSSLLEAMTWALFGQSRSTSDDDVVNRLASVRGEAAEVKFTFALEESVYRVVRKRKRNGRASLEFQLQSGETWTTLSESKMRETQAKIEQTLRMNYETFINVSFFLQGQADAFTTQTAGKRKEILADLLGVNEWELYRSRAREGWKAAENDLRILDARISDSEAELLEKEAREQRLQLVEAEAKAVAAQLEAQEGLLGVLKKAAEAVAQQKTVVASLQSEQSGMVAKRGEIDATLGERKTQREQYANVLARKDEITESYRQYEQFDEAVKEWQKKGEQFNRVQGEMRPFEDVIGRAESRLSQQKVNLEGQKAKVGRDRAERGKIEKKVDEATVAIAQLEIEIEALNKQRIELTQFQTELKTLTTGEQPRLKEQMDEIKEKMEALKAQSGESCPYCQQVLTDEHLAVVLGRLQKEGKLFGDAYRANRKRLGEMTERIEALSRVVRETADPSKKLQKSQQTLARHEAKLAQITADVEAWKRDGKVALATVTAQLETGDFEEEARAKLGALAAELDKVEYDNEAHRKVEQARDGLKVAVEEYRTLGKAEAAVDPLDSAIADLEKQAAELSERSGILEKSVIEGEAKLGALTADVGDVDGVEDGVFALREKRIGADRAVGAAKQDVDVLEKVKESGALYRAERVGVTERIQRLKMLEVACGRDGVQALLIEQALPSIEESANELLGRLSDDQMRVGFVTQEKLKSKKDTLKETLKIQITDNSGERPYENFSGGEQFRINFAIRLALSRILAKRAGARLQTLVIDEGFGSQDPHGRQRLIEAINIIKPDFERILVITHIDELKEAFPTRIEVRKTPVGSQVSVI